MHRRAFTAGLAAFATRAAFAADSGARVGFVTTTPAFRAAFVDALRQLGYQEGRNIVVDWWPNPTGEARVVQDLVNLKPDCLFLAGPNNLSHGRKLTKTIPIVTIDLESDPMASGLVSRLARPGGNVTGIFLDPPELAGKHIQFLQELLPALKRVAHHVARPFCRSSAPRSRNGCSVSGHHGDSGGDTWAIRP